MSDLNIILKSCFCYSLGVVVWFNSCAHINETQNLTFLLELRTGARSQLIVCGTREEGQPPPWQVKDPTSPPSLEDRFVSVWFPWARSGDSPSDPPGFRGWRDFPSRATSTEMWVFQMALARTMSFPGTVAAFLQLSKKKECFLLLSWSFLLINFWNV